ncbi:MAG TPA: hypothetical protein VGL60_11185 [Acidimicrobiales bacterium]
MRSVALSSARLWEEVLERLVRVERSQVEITQAMSRLQAALPAGAARHPELAGHQAAGLPATTGGVRDLGAIEVTGTEVGAGGRREEIEAATGAPQRPTSNDQAAVGVAAGGPGAGFAPESRAPSPSDVNSPNDVNGAAPAPQLSDLFVPAAPAQALADPIAAGAAPAPGPSHDVGSEVDQFLEPAVSVQPDPAAPPPPPPGFTDSGQLPPPPPGFGVAGAPEAGAAGLGSPFAPEDGEEAEEGTSDAKAGRSRFGFKRKGRKQATPEAVAQPVAAQAQVGPDPTVAQAGAEPWPAQFPGEPLVAPAQPADPAPVPVAPFSQAPAPPPATDPVGSFAPPSYPAPAEAAAAPPVSWTPEPLAPNPSPVAYQPVAAAAEEPGWPEQPAHPFGPGEQLAPPVPTPQVPTFAEAPGAVTEAPSYATAQPSWPPPPPPTAPVAPSAPAGFSIEDLRGDGAIGAPPPISEARWEESPFSPASAAMPAPPPAAPPVASVPEPSFAAPAPAPAPPAAPAGFSIEDLQGQGAIGAPPPPPGFAPAAPAPAQPPPVSAPLPPVSIEELGLDHAMPPPPPGFAAPAGYGAAPEAGPTPAGFPVTPPPPPGFEQATSANPVPAPAAPPPPAGFSAADFSGLDAIGGNLEEAAPPSPPPATLMGAEIPEPPITPDFFARAAGRRRR